MAQLTKTSETQEHTDYLIDYLARAWSNIPDIERNWSMLDAVEKEVFQHEWVGITEVRLEQLVDLSRRESLTEEQRSRFEQVMEVVAQHRPVVDYLFEN